MPDFPDTGVAPRITSSSFTVNLLAAGGDSASVQLADVAITVSGTELANLRTAIGNLSNAAVFSTSFTGIVEIAKTKINPLDEAYASAGTKLVISFQDNNLNLRSVAVPAPDEQFFGGDGVTMITPDSGASAGTPAKVLSDAIENIRLVLNGGTLGSGTYALLNGYRSERARKLPKPKIVRASVEPSENQLPGDLPGLPPEIP